jgi:hypothetical protein
MLCSDMSGSIEYLGGPLPNMTNLVMGMTNIMLSSRSYQ